MTARTKKYRPQVARQRPMHPQVHRRRRLLEKTRTADEHVFEHQLGRAWRTAIADEISSKFTLRGPAERHVVAQDFYLFSVLDNRGERAMCRGRLYGIVQLDIRQLLAPNDSFLRFRGQRIPPRQIV